MENAANSPLDIAKIKHVLELNGFTEDRLAVVYLDTVDSTNTEAKRRTKSATGSVLYLAEEQTGGRGRLGKSFVCPRSAGIYASLFCRPEMGAEDGLILTAAAAVAVRRAIASLADISPWIKWVNDIYVDKKKAVGILTEGAVDHESGMLEYAVIGIGINTHPADRGEVNEIATDLETEAGIPICREELLAGVITELLKLIAHPDRAAIAEEYVRGADMRGRRVTVTRAGRTEGATALGVNSDLSLSVEFEDGHKESLISGDVSLKLD